MKHTSVRPNLFFIYLAIALSIGCNKDSYMEGLGYTSDITATPSAQAGRMTFYCTRSSILNCSGSAMEIFINSESKGWVRELSISDPTCGSNSARALTVILPPGTYNIGIYGSGSFCPRYTFTRTITAGQCTLQPF